MEQDYIKSQVDNKIMEINSSNNVFEIGTVVNVKDFIIEVAGLENVMFYEKINVENKAFGYVCNLGENVVTVALLKIEEAINVGDMVHSTNKLYTGSYSPSSFGRVIDLFGEDKLSSKTFTDLINIPIERKTIPIMDRGTVNRPLLTGIAGIDLMYPIGKGQRQLIIGDKRTGKTQIVLDTIVNQKDKNVLCFYVAIGKTKKEVKNIYSELVKRGAIAYTTIITAFNDELPPVISLIPYFALSVAEDYMMQGYDILVCIDDLKRHAEAYREISLISGKKPARDAYPADIFYTHSRLLEKGCQHKDGGSITILPIVETKGGDITDYISTNIISITDGQIVLSANSFQKGEKPAINYGLSVSRLGGAVQNKSMKKVGSVVRQKLLSYLETRSVYELVNVDDMSVELKNQFMEGKIILGNLNQYKFSPKTEEEMISLFGGILGEETAKLTAEDDSSSNNQASTSNVDSSPTIVGVTNVPEPPVTTEVAPVPPVAVPTEVSNDPVPQAPAGIGFVPTTPTPVEVTNVPEEPQVSVVPEREDPWSVNVPVVQTETPAIDVPEVNVETQLANASEIQPETQIIDAVERQTDTWKVGSPVVQDATVVAEIPEESVTMVEDVPEIETVTEVEDVPELAPVTEVEDVPELATVTEVEDVPEIETVTEVEDVPEIETVTEVEDVPEIATVTEVEDVPEIETVTEVEDVPEIATVTEVEDVPEIETVTEVEDVPEIETVTEVEDVPEIATVTEVEDVPEIATVTEVEDVPEIETITEVEDVPGIATITDVEIVPERQMEAEVEDVPEIETISDVEIVPERQIDSVSNDEEIEALDDID